MEILYQSEEEFKKLSSPIPVLLDYRNTYLNQKFFDELKRLGKKYDSLILKTASVGVDGIKKVIAKGYVAFTGQKDKVKYFDSLDEAKEFLVN